MLGLSSNSWVNIGWGVLVSGAFLFGSFACPQREIVTETRLVEDTESKQRLVESIKTEQQLRERLSSAENTISELKIHTTEKVKIVYHKDGTRVVEKIKSTDVLHNVDHRQTSTEDRSQQRASVEDRNIATDTKSHTEHTTGVSLKSKFYLGLSGRVNLSGLSDPGLQFKYRLLDLGETSVWTGAEVFSLTDPQVRVSIGISF